MRYHVAKDGRPWIGVTIHVDEGTEQDLYPGHPLVYTQRQYLETLFRHGMNPLMLPMLNEPSLIREYVKQMDGLLLTGGGYLPLTAASPLPGLRGTAPVRYEFEMALLKEAVPTGMPIMGICRGCQMINEFFGGTLVNLPPDGQVRHQQAKQRIPRHVPVHDMKLESSCRLVTILGQSRVPVNSFHRQAIERPGEGLAVVARAADEVVEAIEGTKHPWLLGLQFHPEWLWPEEPLWSRLFWSFREAALAYRQQRMAK